VLFRSSEFSRDKNLPAQLFAEKCKEKKYFAMQSDSYSTMVL